MDIIITTLNRLAYLKQTFENMQAAQRDKANRYFILDGGSTDGTVDYIKNLFREERIHLAAFYSGNPGADHLKSFGAMCSSGPLAIISSDDLMYPNNFDDMFIESYHKLDSKFPTLGVMGRIGGMKHKDKPHPDFGFRCIRCKMQPAGIFNLERLASLGYFPRDYGPLGSGDHALHKRAKEAKLYSYCINPPLIGHLGKHKAADYPDLHDFYVNTKRQILAGAKEDIHRDKNTPVLKPAVLLAREGGGTYAG